MKHEIIKTDNYLLIVDESEIKGWYYDAYINKVKHSGGAEYGESIITRNIIAHLPLNGSPFLEGVDFLPPLEVEDVEKLALDIFPRHEDWRLNSDNADKRPIWIDGYNQAKEKYKYTEEDMRKAFLKGVSVTAQGYNAEYANDYDPNIECEFGEKADKFIQSLSQPKMPIGFEFEASKSRPVFNGEPKTIWNVAGFTRWTWEGKYIYE